MSDDDDLAVRRQQWWLQALSDAGDAWSCRVHAFVDELPTTHHNWRTSRAITRRRITTFVGCAPTTMTSCSICHSEGYKLLKGISAGEQIFMNVQLPLKHATSCILNCFRRVDSPFLSTCRKKLITAPLVAETGDNVDDVSMRFRVLLGLSAIRLDKYDCRWVRESIRNYDFATNNKKHVIPCLQPRIVHASYFWRWLCTGNYSWYWSFPLRLRNDALAKH